MRILILVSIAILICSVSSKEIIYGGRSFDDFSLKTTNLITLSNGNKHICSGGLLSPLWAITAAQCLTDLKDYKIRKNSTDATTNGILIEIEQHYIHPLFNASQSYEYDVALIRLKNWDTNGFRDDALNSNWMTCNNRQCKKVRVYEVRAWGFRNGSDNNSMEAQRFRLPMLSEKKCKEVYGNKITDNQLCGGYPRDHRSFACTTEPGSLLLCGGDLVGLTTGGFECDAVERKPSLFTNLLTDPIQNWIHEITNLKKYCQE